MATATTGNFRKPSSKSATYVDSMIPLQTLVDRFLLADKYAPALFGPTKKVRYVRRVVNWLRFTLGFEPRLSDLQGPNLSRVYSCLRGRRISDRYLAEFHRAAQIIADYAHKRELIPTRPNLPRPSDEAATPPRSQALQNVRFNRLEPLSIDSKLEELLEQYLSLRLRTAKEHTRRKYWIAIRHYGRMLCACPKLGDLDDEIAAAFRDELIEEGLSPATSNSYLAHICALWRFAHHRGYISRGPTIQAAQEWQHEPVALSMSQFEALLSAAARTDYEISGIPSRRWWRALLLCLYDTGVRVSALRSAEWSGFNSDKQLIRIHPSHQKTGKELVRYLHPDTVKAVLSIYDHRDGLIWDFDRHPSYFWSLSREICLMAGFPDDRRYKLHSIRRMHATFVDNALGEFAAAESLQHSSVMTTRRNYLDQTKSTKAPVVESLPRPNSGQS